MKKILIIAGALHIGGAERVAANLCLYSPEKEFSFDYLIFEGYENVYGLEIERLGGRVITIPSPGTGYIRYFKRLADLIKKNHYCAVHSHTQFNSGLNLAVAKHCNVPIRIAHSHTTRTERRVSLLQKMYEGAMRILLRQTATHFLACGEEAGAWMFGKKTFSKRGNVIKNGIDVSAFAYSSQYRQKMRELLEIDKDTFVVGHAGTLLPLKNQEYLIRLLPDIRKHRQNAVLLLLGAGTEDERNRLKEIAKSLDVDNAVIFGGGVNNVNEYLSAMDVFAFPSLREGTPLALLEAQANGLPCIISDRIPKDAILTDLIHSVSLDDKSDWSREICSAERKNSESYATVITKLGYDSKHAYDSVYDVYRSIATVSLSFDDGRGDNTRVLDEMLITRDIPATLNISTGYVDGTCPDELRPTDLQPMSVDDVRRLYKSQLVEIAMHGDCHQNTMDDICRGEKKLKAWLGLSENDKLGFASPGSGISLQWFRSSDGEHLRNGLVYLRTSLRTCSLTPLRILARKAARVIHLPFLYRFAYADTIMTEADDQILYSVPIMRDATFRQVLSVIKLAVRKRGAVVLMLHSVDDRPRTDDNWTWDKKKMDALCNELVRYEQEGMLSLCTTFTQYQLLQRRK